MKVNGYTIEPKANLRGANLYAANLQEADLQRADLQGANLQGADLRGAYLQGVKNIPQHVVNQTNIVPETGSFDAWKKCREGVIVKVRIPAKAKRSNATTTKCRASEVKVLEVIGAEEGTSTYNEIYIYRKGETVKCDTWEEDRFVECGGGIHFFMTRAQAEAY